MDFNKTLNINKRFVLIMLLVVGIVLISSYSYALFQVNFIKSNVVVLKSASNLNITTTIDSTSSDTFTLNANESKQITVHLTTDGITSAMAYKMYYELIGDGAFTVTSTESFTDDKVEGIMQPITKTGYDYKVTGKDIVLTFTNNSTNSLTIKLGAIGGFEKTGASLTNEEEIILGVELPRIYTSLDIKNNFVNKTCQNETLTYIEDGITYISGSKDCIDFNYLWYSGKMWRIVAIYPDGAMKLVTENNITSISFNDISETQMDFYTDVNMPSYVYQWLNEDFYDTLYNASNFIDGNKQWNETETNGNSFGEIIPETMLISSNVGLLNSYEYYNSYRNLESPSSGYLNNGYSWWLLNPVLRAPDLPGVQHVTYNTNLNVRQDGSIGSITPNNVNGVRPSIFLKSGVNFVGGGTSNNPYKIVGDMEQGKVGDDINTRISGEYVKLSSNGKERLFRIIETNEEGQTKIVAMDSVDSDDNHNRIEFDNADNTIWGSNSLYFYLNDYFVQLTDDYGELFERGLYYLGTSDYTSSYYQTFTANDNMGYNYKLSVCNSTDIESPTIYCMKTLEQDFFDIGLPRYGELFATNQVNQERMWLISRYSNNLPLIWIINYGLGDARNPDSMMPSYPTLHLKSYVKIKSGSGLPDDPYIVGL